MIPRELAYQIGIRLRISLEEKQTLLETISVGAAPHTRNRNLDRSESTDRLSINSTQQLKLLQACPVKLIGIQ